MCLATPSAPLIGEKNHYVFFSMENVLNIESKRSSLHNASGCIRIQRSSLQNTSEKLITFKRLERREAGGGKSSVELHQISRAWSLWRPELLWDL